LTDWILVVRLVGKKVVRKVANLAVRWAAQLDDIEVDKLATLLAAKKVLTLVFVAAGKMAELRVLLSVG